ncbi:hypothetical protein GUJ93_ZPchr0013g37658 [Zizania palustris]|uniref:Uncharacterized protein n=1 Tax=Zizania palustris TaxID=103762 RepID=A0A8J5WW84_ZIZPA|nr:hypothetical protein GUJ93_ZPchr0013g37658 [Zizania palustris]
MLCHPPRQAEPFCFSSPPVQLTVSSRPLPTSNHPVPSCCGADKTSPPRAPRRPPARPHARTGSLPHLSAAAAGRVLPAMWSLPLQCATTPRDILVKPGRTPARPQLDLPPAPSLV